VAPDAAVRKAAVSRRARGRRHAGLNALRVSGIVASHEDRNEERRDEMSLQSGRAMLVIATILAATLLPQLARAQAFDEGSSSVSISLGAGKQLDRDYTVLAGRYGYYFVREFEASLTIEAWRGNDPAIYKIEPELRYVYARVFPIKPYIGLFLSRTLYQGITDRNTYGAKLGAYFTLNPNAHLAIGAVYERIEGCDENVYRDCRQVYPEVGLHFTF
jgi:hypothetical protein